MSQRSLRPAGSPWFAEAAGVRTNEWSSHEGARGREDQAPRGAPGGATPATGAVEEAKRHLGSGHWQVSAELVPPTVQGAASPHGAASGPLRSLAGCRWHRAGDSLLAGTLRAELFSSWGTKRWVPRQAALTASDRARSVSTSTEALTAGPQLQGPREAWTLGNGPPSGL